MLSCAKGEVAAVSMMAIVRAPKPNICSVQSCRPKNRPMFGSDRMVASDREPEQHLRSPEYSRECLLNSHMRDMRDDRPPV